MGKPMKKCENLWKNDENLRKDEENLGKPWEKWRRIGIFEYRNTFHGNIGHITRYEWATVPRIVINGATWVSASWASGQR